MRAHLNCLTILAVLLGMSTTPTFSQDEIAATRGEMAIENLLQWDEGPAGFLMTKKEKKDWKKIASEAEAERFIDLFWARRNPVPSQSFNTFKAQFESRVRYADENFSYKGGRGALSDRGRVLIVLGPPQQAEHRGATETVQSMGGLNEDPLNRASDEVRANAVMWVYDPARLPDEFGVRGSRLLFVFYEERIETNEFVLDRSHPEATMGLRVLNKAPEVFLIHPELNEVPKPVSVPGARAATAVHLGWLDDASARWTDGAQTLIETGIADAENRPIWLHLEMPPEAPELDLLVGRVLSPEGEVLSNFALDAEPLSRGDHTAYHVGFPLAHGTYRLEIAGAAAGTPQVVYSSEVTVPEAPTEGTWMSPLWVGVESEVLDDAMLGSPFCFGRLHLVPLMPGSDVSRQSEMMFLGFVVRPPVDDSGAAKLRARVELSRDGKRLGRPLEMPVEVVQLVDDLYVYMNAINLSALPEAGQYAFSFTVSEPDSDLSAARELAVNVVE